MKKRNGFVSNSSSSSFIVAFTKVPQSVAETEEMLFLHEDTVCSCWDEDEKFPTKLIAARVYEDIQHRSEINKKGFIGELEYIVLHPNYEMFFPESQRLHKLREANGYKWENKNQEKEYNKAKKQEVDKFIKTKMKVFAGKKLYIFEYHDDCGDKIEAVMEHGNIFRELPHFRINKH